MKLNQLINYIESLGLDNPIDRLQESYTSVIDKIRLNPVTLPIRCSGKIKVPSLLGTPWVTVDSYSEIKIKEIIGFRGVKYDNVDLDSENITEPLVGDLKRFNEGYGYEELETTNENKTIIPLLSHKEDIILVDSEDAFFLIECFKYPYPVIYGDAYTNTHFYSISRMVELYGQSKLEIDNTLGMFMLLETIRNYYRDNMRINDEAMLEKYTKDFLNMFNMSDNDLIVSLLSSMKQTRKKL